MLATGPHLDALIEATDRTRRRDDDPVSFVHRYEHPADREVVALIAALLAFGNVKAIRTSIGRALERLGDGPAHAIDTLEPSEIARRLEGFVHRVYRGEDLARVLSGAGRLRREHGSIGEAIVHFAADDSIEIPGALASRARLVRVLAGLGDALRGPPPHRSGLVHLVPDVRRGSACKRLLLYLRWMCRAEDGIDLGLSRFPASELVIPLDTHVHRIARNLDLTRRPDASMKTAVEITEALSRFDANDPVKYDFAICHLGVSRQCPSRKDPERCGSCVVRAVCRHWRARR